MYVNCKYIFQSLRWVKSQIKQAVSSLRSVRAGGDDNRTWNIVGNVDDIKQYSEKCGWH